MEQATFLADEDKGRGDGSGAVRGRDVISEWKYA
jgi:hypothetical protein